MISLTLASALFLGSFLRPGRIALGAYFDRVVKDPQSARGSLLNTTPIVKSPEVPTYLTLFGARELVRSVANQILRPTPMVRSELALHTL